MDLPANRTVGVNRAESGYGIRWIGLKLLDVKVRVRAAETHAIIWLALRSWNGGFVDEIREAMIPEIRFKDQF